MTRKAPSNGVSVARPTDPDSGVAVEKTIRQDRRPSAAHFGLVVVVIVVAMGGCAGYRWGNSSLYRPDVQTIAVPIIQSNSYRPYLGERLTEAVIREVQRQTPYQVTTVENAQSVLRVQLDQDTKQVIGENVNDDPRDIEVGLRISFTWTNRLGQSLTNRPVHIIDEFENFIPEGGQSMVTAQQDIIDRLAKRIVQQLEADW